MPRSSDHLSAAALRVKEEAVLPWLYMPFVGNFMSQAPTGQRAALGAGPTDQLSDQLLVRRLPPPLPWDRVPAPQPP